MCTAEIAFFQLSGNQLGLLSAIRSQRRIKIRSLERCALTVPRNKDSAGVFAQITIICCGSKIEPVNASSSVSNAPSCLSFWRTDTPLSLHGVLFS